MITGRRDSLKIVVFLCIFLQSAYSININFCPHILKICISKPNRLARSIQGAYKTAQSLWTWLLG